MNRTCTVCPRKHKAGGYCATHYTRWWKHGDPHFVGTNVLKDYYVSEVEHLAGFGETPERIAAALGVTPSALARALYRAGRNDLANPFQALTRQTQKKEAA